MLHARWKYRTQISASAHHRTTLSGYIFASKACINNRKKLLNSNISSTCCNNMANFGHQRLISVLELGNPANFNRFRFLASLLQQSTSFTGRLPNFARCLTASWASTLCIHFQQLLDRDGILPGANFSLRPSLAFSYIGNITAWHSTSGRHPNFAAWYTEQNYGTFADGATRIRLGGHHVGHAPTFQFIQ